MDVLIPLEQGLLRVFRGEGNGIVCGKGLIRAD